MKKVVIGEKPPAAAIISHIGIITGTVLLGMVLFTFIGLSIASLVYNLPTTAFTITDYNTVSPIIINGLKIVQVFAVLGMFILPAIILPKIIFREDILQFNGLRHNAGIIFFVLAALMYFALTPILELSIALNMRLDLPDFLHGLEVAMKKAEDANNALTKRFIQMQNMQDFLVNTLVIAVLAAVAEELFFRGFLQRTIFNWWHKKHLSVILTAAIFSFIHFQFYGFLPRMLLGILLGYAYLWTADLKVPILIHFLNNFTTLVIAYSYNMQGADLDPTSAIEYPWYIYVLSAAIGGGLIYLLYSRSRGKKVETENIVKQQAWIGIYTTTNVQQAEIIAGRLKSEGVEAVTINRQSSQYPVLGEIEVMIPASDKERAILIIQSELESL